MSTQRFTNQKIVSAGVLRGLRRPRRTISDTLTDLLAEMERAMEVGDEVLWDTLTLTVEPERKVADGLRFRSTVSVLRNDLVAGMTAIALAEHERNKTRREDA